MRECGLAHCAKCERCERVPELCGGEIAVEMLRDPPRDLRARASLGRHRRELRRPHFDDREFSGDEETVRDDEAECQKEIPTRHSRPHRASSRSEGTTSTPLARWKTLDEVVNA